MTNPADTFYVTTPIYYVNDRPHVGHCYTTVLADVLARFMRMTGRDTFFLTGTDEHAEKVVESAEQNNVTPLEWADRNADEFQRAFAALACTNDDFIRTTQDRHTSRVIAYIEKLQSTGDIYLGDYEGWYDPSQEEYLTENVAREAGYKSPVTGRDLVKRSEKNYFFKLSAYADRLRAHIDANPDFIRPDARRNEVLGRLDSGLQDVPVSRAVREGDTGWGILMPGDDSHRVYVWIDALCNYLSTVDTPDRKVYWPAQVHMIAKDILWFHAVIWPAMLMALGEDLPGCVYAHSFFIREGRKMSKSLGNFLDLPTIEAYCAEPGSREGVQSFGTDAFRWYLVTQGPLDATDADFSYAKFVEVYNADLANGIGNASSRVNNMIEKYFDGACPEPGEQTEVAKGDKGYDLSKVAPNYTRIAQTHMSETRLAAAATAAREIVKRVDGYINETKPFTLAKQEGRMGEVGTILYECAEALRIAAVLLSPFMPGKMGDLLATMSQPRPSANGSFDTPFDELTAWGGLKPGTKIVKGDGLFPRADGKLPEPAPA